VHTCKLWLLAAIFDRLISLLHTYVLALLKSFLTLTRFSGLVLSNAGIVFHAKKPPDHLDFTVRHCLSLRARSLEQLIFNRLLTGLKALTTGKDITVARPCRPRRPLAGVGAGALDLAFVSVGAPG
jgi:hypothetical protein